VICIGRMQGSGRKILRNEFREVERLRGVKCFPGSETQFVGNTSMIKVTGYQFCRLPIRDRQHLIIYMITNV